MKVLVVVTCVLAAAAAGWAPIYHHGPQHVPVIHNGVPLDTPEVQQARAEHLAAVAKAKASDKYEHHENHYDYNNGETHYDQHQDTGYYNTENNNNDYSYSVHHEIPSHHISEHYEPTVHYDHHATDYETSHAFPVIGHDGHPIDTPEVEAAKSAHFAAINEALVKQHYRKRRSLESNTHGFSIVQAHAPVYGHNEHEHEIHDHEYNHEIHDHEYNHEIHTPIYHHDEHNSYDHHDVIEHTPIQHHYSHGHYEQVPEIGHDGKPLDTPEVEHAKQAHFEAHREALARIAAHKAEHGHGTWNNQYDHVDFVDPHY